jgi:transposase
MATTNMERIHQNAAGIDIGTQEFHVSTDGQTVRVFNTYSESIIQLIRYLKQEGVETVAIEATGVLWVSLYDMLEEAGIEVFLVNGHHVRNVPAQKTDFKDCRWLQKLHSYGLLRSSFVPTEEIRELRTYLRLREDHIESATESTQHMQRAFELMNIKLHNVISEITGKSGLAIIEAILSGETDSHKLLKLCNRQIIKNKSTQVIASLKGNYKKEYLFLLKQARHSYQFFQQQIKECDKEIELLLEKITKDLPEPDEKTPSSPSRHNQPDVKNLHEHMVKLTIGRNACVLPGLCDKTILKLIGELGTDLSRWPDEKHFISWLGLSPRRNDSGKMKRTKRTPAKTKAGQIFRESAMSISSSKYLALKGFYNRIKSRHGYKVAIKATARKIAVLFYRFMTKGLEYVENGLVEYEKKYKESMLRNIEKKAKSYGCVLVRA